jgi:hypothetical protein
MFIEATSEIASRITGAIRDAARATGANFEYLLTTAQRESNLDPNAKAASSSATGLFQFIDQTWLETLKRAGPELGYGRYAEGIVQSASGQYAVPDPAQRQAIMQLRNDPAAASAMAGAFTSRNAAALAGRLGRNPSEGELYIAHFLGPTGAAQLIEAAAGRPQGKAADLFPAAARANRSIFHDVRGKARTNQQVYEQLAAKHERLRARAPGEVGAQSAVASTGSVTDVRTTPANPPAVITAATSDSVLPERSAYAGETGPVFHTLFRTQRNSAVSPVVSELWGAKNVQFPVQMKAPAPASFVARPAAGPPVDLFQFLRPELRSLAKRSA